MNARNGAAYVETSFTSRKILPAIPGELDPRTSSRKPNQQHQNAVVYGRYLKEFLLSSEYKKVKDDPPPGLYVIPSGLTPFVWHGVLFVRGGFYRGGVFRFRVQIPEAFPDTDKCPQVIFTPPIFHPFIDPETGEFDLSGAFDKWCCSFNHVQQLLKHVRNSFYAVSSANEPLEFWHRARIEVEASLARVGDKVDSPDDPHALMFSEYVPQVHDIMRVAFKKPQMEYGSTSIPGSAGLSYMRRPGSSSPDDAVSVPQQVSSNDSDYVTM